MCTWMGVGNDPRYTPTTCFETFPFPAGLSPMDTASQKIETLPGGAIIPAWPPATEEANDSESNQPPALIERAQAASKSIAPAIPEGGWAAAGSAQVKKEPAQRAGDTEQNPLPPSRPEHAAPAQPVRNNAIAIAQAAHHLNQQRENWLNPTQWVDWVQTPEEDQAGYPKRPVAKPGFEAELKKRTLTNLYNARPAWLTLAHQALDKAVAAAYGWHDYTPEMPDDEILRRLLALNLARSAPTI